MFYVLYTVNLYYKNVYCQMLIQWNFLIFFRLHFYFHMLRGVNADDNNGPGTHTQSSNSDHHMHHHQMQSHILLSELPEPPIP